MRIPVCNPQSKQKADIMSMNGSLRRYAINAAKKGNWDEAIEYNQQILEQYPDNTNALNRLGIAYAQLKDVKKAKKAFQDTLRIDKTNIIAQKHLDRLKKNQDFGSPAFAPIHFIEEPGRTKSINLHRLANKQILESLAVGMSCELRQKNRYISVEVNGKYIGALPEDISFRLGKLIENGNRYSCSVRTCNGKVCSVYIKETYRSAKNANVQSFPGNKHAVSQLADIDESYLISEEIPLEIVDTDRDVERSIDYVDSDDLED